MSRGPRPQKALSEAIPIAKARGIVQMALSGPERIFDIAIVSKIPVTFTRVMFAPAILATTRQLAEDFKEEIAQLRIIARDASITAGLWIRSKHGTWRLFCPHVFSQSPGGADTCTIILPLPLSSLPVSPIYQIVKRPWPGKSLPQNRGSRLPATRTPSRQGGVGWFFVLWITSYNGRR